MYIELLETIENKSPYGWGLPHTYKQGTILKVEYTRNLPKTSDIVFWVAQDGWEKDSYGFPIYSDTDYVLTTEKETK